MTKIVYVGENDEVEVPSLELSVKHGDTIDVPDEVADTFLSQSDNWHPATKAKEAVK